MHRHERLDIDAHWVQRVLPRNLERVRCAVTFAAALADWNAAQRLSEFPSATKVDVGVHQAEVPWYLLLAEQLARGSTHYVHDLTGNRLRKETDGGLGSVPFFSDEPGNPYLLAGYFQPDEVVAYAYDANDRLWEELQTHTYDETFTRIV